MPDPVTYCGGQFDCVAIQTVIRWTPGATGRAEGEGAHSRGVMKPSDVILQTHVFDKLTQDIFRTYLHRRRKHKVGVSASSDGRRTVACDEVNRWCAFTGTYHTVCARGSYTFLAVRAFEMLLMYAVDGNEADPPGEVGGQSPNRPNYATAGISARVEVEYVPDADAIRSASEQGAEELIAPRQRLLPHRPMRWSFLRYMGRIRRESLTIELTSYRSCRRSYQEIGGRSTRRRWLPYHG